MRFELPDLPYSSDALDPHISAETLRIHHGKHHAAYVDKLNALIADSDIDAKSLEEIIHATAGQPDSVALFNNAAQAWNHSFYWQCMAPHGGGLPSGSLAARIEQDFHGFENFRSRFRAAATGQFGSGWAWLVLDNGKLEVISTPNATPPQVNNQEPLLTCDVWEHAYYLDYQNRRPDYVDMFLEKLVNWDFVAHRLAEADKPAAAA